MHSRDEYLKVLRERYFKAKTRKGYNWVMSLLLASRIRYTSATEYLEGNLAECLTYLRFPSAHWKVIRTSNLLEQTFGEGKRRTNVITRFPTESAGLRLLYATLITASRI